MTTEVLLLDFVHEDEGESAPPCVRLAARAYPSDARGFVSLTRECDSIESFEQAVSALKESMDVILQRAREAFEQHRSQVEDQGPGEELQSVKGIWEALEQCTSVERMQAIFNPLDLAKRQEVADYVFTELNIFKGAASSFSQHYNEEEYILE
ncbi:MAG: hypothetical protein JSU72_16385 [Deltaproteobacteria bacterium]|nr:MAG: hypothetical protein JSU72_16385 [Deltaproteobacteria bacterium]